MDKVKKGYWDYLEKWSKAFPKPEELAWKETYFDNGYCAGCRYCCGPQDSDSKFRMALLPSQIGPSNKDDFYMLDASAAYLGKDGCKSDTSTGCRLPREKRPLACGLFPIVLINGRLYLYQKCPAVLFTPLVYFSGLALEAAEMLMFYDIEELRHLSNKSDIEVLSENYIDLHIQLFDEEGKKLILS